MRKVVSIILVAAGLSFLLSACVKEGRTSVTMKLDDNSDREVTVGDTVYLKAIISPPEGNYDVKWEAADTNVVKVRTVELAGGMTDRCVMILANVPGEAKVSVTVNDSLTDACKIIVREIPPIVPEKVTLNKRKISVKKDYTDTLTYEVIPSDAKVTSVTWSVRDGEIAGCSQKGVVVGLTPGETWVYVEINGALGDSCHVTCLDRVYGGTVVTDSIFSDTLNATVKYNVYLPDSYERSNKQYPIVYLLHGLGGDYTNWANSGNVAKTSDNLMGSGEADEMVIIMPNAGGGDYHYVQHGYFNVNDWHYENFFFEEFIPEMEARYRAIGDRGHRAIMGLSMGGGGSVVYCQHHPEMFSSCYAMSGWFYLRPYEEEALKDLTRDKFYLTCESVMVNSTLKFLENADEQTIRDLNTIKWVIDCGDKDYIAEESKATYDKMTEVGIESEYTVRSGAHNWEYWRQSLRLALPFATRGFYGNR